MPCIARGDSVSLYAGTLPLSRSPPGLRGHGPAQLQDISLGSSSPLTVSLHVHQQLEETHFDQCI